MNKISIFLKTSYAAITGDTDKVVALKNYKKAKATIDAQIAKLKYKQVEDAQAVEDAEESLSQAKYPGKLITNGESYLSGIHAANDRLKAAKANAASTDASIAFNVALLAEFDTEVDAEEAK